MVLLVRAISPIVLNLTRPRAIANRPPTSILAGTGKTMLVKAVANSTTASFIRVVGSEFVQKYLGEVSPGIWPSAWLFTHHLHDLSH